MRQRSRAAGFTLVELMVAVAIVGILASMAIPEFHKFQYRSKQSERGLMLTSIERAVEDYWMRESRYPQDWGGGVSALNLWDNPGWPPAPHKRPFRLANWGDHWSRLSLKVEGGLYYDYWGNATAQPAPQPRTVSLWAESDLDGDRVYNCLFWRQKTYVGAAKTSDVTTDWAQWTRCF